MRTSAYAEAPYQGVSQAPPQVRLATQASALDDMLVPVPTGAGKRPPFEWVTSLSGLSSSDLAHSYLAKGSVGNFLLVASNVAGVVTPRLYRVDGLPTSSPSLAPTAVTISSAAQAYLSSGNPSPGKDLVMMTLEDYTFILNKKVKVALSGVSASSRPHEAMLWVRQAAYARTYQVIVRYGATTVTVSLRTPNGKDATDGVDVDTDVIAKGLFDGTYPTGTTSLTNGATISGNLSSLTGAGFTVTNQGGVIYISHPSQDFTLEVKDGQGGAALVAVKDKVQSSSDLPKKAPVAGFTVRITQQTGTSDDDFFLRWSESAGHGTGVWEECIAPGSPLGIDQATMPVGLVYNAGAGTWSIDVLPWEGRTVGDATMCPDPGYLGQYLKDISYWRGRLALLYNEGARLSSASNLFTMYPTTLAVAKADDPFEVINPLEGQAEFEHVVAFKKVLILWGRKGQAQVHTNGQPLTEANAVTEPYAHYEVSPLVRPQGSNDRIYFAAPRGASATAVYEIEVPVSGNEVAAEGDDMSVAVPRYISPGVDRAATCSVNYMTVYGVTGATHLFTHLYRYAERQRVQNAWSRWFLPVGCTLAGFYFINTSLYVLALRGGVVHLLRLDTAEGVTDVGAEYLSHLDFKVTDAVCTRTYNTLTGITTLTLPFAPATKPVVLVSPPGGVAGVPYGSAGTLSYTPEGTVAGDLTWTAGSSVVSVVGDWTSVPLVIGENLVSQWTLSPILYRDPAGRPNRTGRLMLRKITFDLDRTVALSVEVTRGGRDAVVYSFESALLDTPEADYDRVNLYSGPWEVPIGAVAEDVTVRVLFDSWAPANILGYTWEGEINPKAARMQGQ